MIDERQKHEFSTLDLYFAAYLTMQNVDSAPVLLNNGKVIFLFDIDKKDLTTHMDNYAVSPENKFAREVKNLRGIMNKMRKKQ